MNVRGRLLGVTEGSSDHIREVCVNVCMRVREVARHLTYAGTQSVRVTQCMASIVTLCACPHVPYVSVVGRCKVDVCTVCMRKCLTWGLTHCISAQGFTSTVQSGNDQWECYL